MSLQLLRRPSVSSRGRARKDCRSRLRLEPLEGRDLLTAVAPVDFGATITSPPVAMNGDLYFSATDPAHGDELWRSDGTAAGTALVKDIHPGAAKSSPAVPDGRRRHAVLHGQRRHPRHGAVEERRHRRRHRPGQGRLPPARTARTRRTSSTWTARCSSRRRRRRRATSCGRATAPPPAPSWSRTSTPAPPAPYSGEPHGRRTARCFFTANDGTHGNELWKSDGTAAGTVLVKDINPGTGELLPRRS